MLTGNKFRLEVRLTALNDDGTVNEVRHNVDEVLELVAGNGVTKIRAMVPGLCAGNPIVVNGQGGSQMSTVLDWLRTLSGSPLYRPLWMEHEAYAEALKARGKRAESHELFEFAPSRGEGKAPEDWRHALVDLGLTGHLSTALYNAIHNYLYGPEHALPAIKVTDWVQIGEVLGGNEFLLEGVKMKLRYDGEANTLFIEKA